MVPSNTVRGTTLIPQAGPSTSVEDRRRRRPDDGNGSTENRTVGDKTGDHVASVVDTVVTGATQMAKYGRDLRQTAVGTTGRAASGVKNNISNTVPASTQPVTQTPATVTTTGGMSRGAIIGVLMGLGSVAAAALVAPFISLASVPSWGSFALGAVVLGVAIVVASMLNNQRQGAVSGSRISGAPAHNSHSRVTGLENATSVGGATMLAPTLNSPLAPTKVDVVPGAHIKADLKEISRAQEKNFTEIVSSLGRIERCNSKVTTTLPSRETSNPASMDMGGTRQGSLTDQLLQLKVSLDLEAQRLEDERKNLVEKVNGFSEYGREVNATRGAENSIEIAELDAKIQRFNASVEDINERRNELTKVTKEALATGGSASYTTPQWQALLASITTLQERTAQVLSVNQSIRKFHDNRAVATAQAQQILAQCNDALANLENSAKATTLPEELLKTFETAEKDINESTAQIRETINEIKAIETRGTTLHSNVTHNLRLTATEIKTAIKGWTDSETPANDKKLSLDATSLDALQRRARDNVQIATINDKARGDVVTTLQQVAQAPKPLRTITTHKIQKEVLVTPLTFTTIVVDDDLEVGKTATTSATAA